MLNVLIFTVSGYSLGLEIGDVKEIIHIPGLLCPPGMPGCLEGLFNLDGKIVPVVNMARLLGLKEDVINLYTPMLLLNGQFPMAVIVNTVLEITQVKEQPIAVEENILFKNLIKSVIYKAKNKIYLLDIKNLFLEQEQKCINDFREKEQQRILNLQT